MSHDEPATGDFIYDADCGICTRFSADLMRCWSTEHYGVVSFQALGVEGCASRGFTLDAARRSAFWSAPGRAPRSGHAAVAAALVACGGWRRALGRVIDAPLVRWISAPIYRVVADNRHRLPGPAACVTAPPSCEAPEVRHG